MSLYSLLNPDDLDSGRSMSARSTPDPTTPGSVTSLAEPWTPATRLSSLHHRNESLESTVSASSLKPREELEKVRYPPFNELDANSRQLAMRFNVEPLGAIVPSSRPVSYNSEKRSLKAKTGLSKFHVFQYSFQLEGEDKKWWVMWDYRLGLVRFTPFFKCLKYNKTAPAKMVQVNPGLDEIKHSITGGSIHAQGYWIPYNCARELATKFCHPIAGALIPIFGPSFPRDCLHPSSSGFEDMVISQDIIRAATMDALRCLDRQKRSRVSSKSPAITSHPYSRDGSVPDVHLERRRLEGRWSEPPDTLMEMPQPAMPHSHWNSRPGTQDGSSLSAYNAAPRATPPQGSHSSYPSPHSETLPSLRRDASLPPLRDCLQAMASQSLAMRPHPASSRASERGDAGIIDPRLLRDIDDEGGFFPGPGDERIALHCDEDQEMSGFDCGGEDDGLAAVAKAAIILINMRYVPTPHL